MAYFKCKFSGNEFNIGDELYAISSVSLTGIVGSGVISNRVIKPRLSDKRAFFHNSEDAINWAVAKFTSI